MKLAAKNTALEDKPINTIKTILRAALVALVIGPVSAAQQAEKPPAHMIAGTFQCDQFGAIPAGTPAQGGNTLEINISTIHPTAVLLDSGAIDPLTIPCADTLNALVAELTDVCHFSPVVIRSSRYAQNAYGHAIYFVCSGTQSHVTGASVVLSETTLP